MANMSSYKNSPNFSHNSMECTGVLLCNLGSPDAPTTDAVRRYLDQFLWDPRVIEMSRPLWWLILHGVILRIRPKRSAHAYQSVWTEAGSPLINISKRQTAALQQLLEKRMAGPVKVEMAMRYGNPSIPAALERLRQANAQRILILPMYPQYSGTTTASIFDAVFDELKTWRRMPELRLINHFHDDERYIDSLVSSIREQFEANGQPQRLIFSFHGIPKRYLLNGDPYFCQCHKVARLTVAKLGLSDDQWQVTFQSRVGREEWLKPYTDHVLEQLPKEGIKNIAIVCPAFSADCLETLEEIAVENRDRFIKAGGENYHYIPALNDRPDYMEAMAELAMRHMQGWQELDVDWNVSHVNREAELRQQRAKALGAKG